MIVTQVMSESVELESFGPCDSNRVILVGILKYIGEFLSGVPAGLDLGI